MKTHSIACALLCKGGGEFAIGITVVAVISDSVMTGLEQILGTIKLSKPMVWLWTVADGEILLMQQAPLHFCGKGFFGSGFVWLQQAGFFVCCIFSI